MTSSIPAEVLAALEALGKTGTPVYGYKKHKNGSIELWLYGHNKPVTYTPPKAKTKPARRKRTAKT